MKQASWRAASRASGANKHFRRPNQIRYLRVPTAVALRDNVDVQSYLARMEFLKFTFKPVTMSDVPLLHGWLNRPHVADRWNNATTLSDVETKYRAHLKSTSVFPFVVELNGKPIGFIQSYNAELVGEGWWENEPLGTWGVDQYLGEESLLGRGFGSEFIRIFTDDLLSRSQVKRVITDPAPDNKRAIRAYEKAGFVGIGIIQTPDGPAFLMEKVSGT